MIRFFRRSTSMERESTTKFVTPRLTLASFTTANYETLLSFDNLLPVYNSLLLAGVGGYFLARKSLAPVAAMGAQVERISGANLHAGEDGKLDAEKRVLANSERILSAAMGAYDALYEGNVSAAAR